MQPWWEKIPQDRFLSWLVRLGSLRYAPAEQQRKELPELKEQALAWGAKPLATPGVDLAPSDAQEHPPGIQQSSAAGTSPAEHWAWLEAALAHPEHRLVVYGTLAPGECNHWVVEHIPGRWHAGMIRGHLDWWGIIPYLTWCPQKPWLEVQVFCSTQLPLHWEEIDLFEGEAYRRVLVPAQVDERYWLCYVYHARDTWPPPGFPFPKS